MPRWPHTHVGAFDGLAAAQREQKAVLVDLWATWCQNCLTMDRTTLADPAVTDALGKLLKIKFQAEDPDDAAVKAVMQRFGAVGLPTYVVSSRASERRLSRGQRQNCGPANSSGPITHCNLCPT
jgi:thiol:disulfide interchange protein